MSKEIKHLQFLIQAVTDAYPGPNQEQFMNTQLQRLVEAIGMKQVIAPRSVYITNPLNAGMTGQIGIETSHIAYHVWDEVHDNDLIDTWGSMLATMSGRTLWQMDIYTCGCLSESDIAHIKNFMRPFGLNAIHYMLIDRKAGFKVLKEGFIYENPTEFL
jgi:S-adenosylmethionine/arginine decarboxylase-like enzyme